MPPEPFPNGYYLGGDETDSLPIYTNVTPPRLDDDQSLVAYEYGPNGGYVSLHYADIVSGDYGSTIAWQNVLKANGYLKGSYSRGNWDPASRDALLTAMWVANKQRDPLSEMLNRGAQLAQEAAQQAAPYTGPTTTTSTTNQVNLSSRPTARGVLTAALQNELGREPSRKEVDDFLKGLNIAEKKNPAVQTTTSTRDPDPENHTVAVTTNTTTKQSKVDPADRAERYAETVDPKEAHRYQTGNYYSVIANMLGV